MVNHQVRLAARPLGLPTADCWSFTEEPVPTPGEGQFVVKVSHLSIDPAMRGWMNDARSYIRPVGIGEVMRALCIGEVVVSHNSAFPVGATVSGTFGVQEYAVSDGRGASLVDLALAPATTYLGVLGMTGMTAYFGLLEEGRPQPGDTVVVSGAAGAVGSTVGQIAKIKGCRVVGIAGGPEKCRTLTEDYGFDAAIDYKSSDAAGGLGKYVSGELRKHAPEGIDVFFDNVGGDILDAALTRLDRGARVVICGAISQYNADTPVRGPANYLSLLVNRASMKGMVVFDYADRYPVAVRELAGWLAEGRLLSRDDVVAGGVAAFPDTLMRLFRGENMGKLILSL